MYKLIYVCVISVCTSETLYLQMDDQLPACELTTIHSHVPVRLYVGGCCA